MQDYLQSHILNIFHVIDYIRGLTLGFLLFEAKVFVRYFKEKVLSAIEKEEILTLICYPIVMVFCFVYLVTDSQWVFGGGVGLSVVLMGGEAFLTRKYFTQNTTESIDASNT